MCIIHVAYIYMCVCKHIYLSISYHIIYIYIISYHIISCIFTSRSYLSDICIYISHILYTSYMYIYQNNTYTYIIIYILWIPHIIYIIYELYIYIIYLYIRYHISFVTTPQGGRGLVVLLNHDHGWGGGGLELERWTIFISINKYTAKYLHILISYIYIYRCETYVKLMWKYVEI